MTAQEIKSRIENLKQQLVVKYHPDKVILFGSAARG
jgi:predicted nucleotidyltransferase